MTLTMPGGHKVNKSKTYWIHFLTHFSSDQNEIWCGDVAIQVDHLKTIASKTFKVCKHVDVNEWIWFKLGLMIITIVLYIWY